MKLYYCTKCGSRLPNEDAARIQPDEEPTNIFCVGCAPQLQPAPVEYSTANLVPKSATHTPALPARAVSSRPRTTELRTRPGINAGAGASTASTRSATRTGQATQPGTATKSGSHAGTRNNSLIYIGGGVVAFAILIALMVIAGSGSKTESRVAQNDPVKPESPKPAPTKIENPAKVEKPVESKSAVDETPRPAPLADPVLSPKEDYERRVKAGLIKASDPTPVAPPAPAPAPVADAPAATGPLPAYSADDPSWHLLFNGKDLSGWHDAKGHFAVEDGTLAHAPSKNNADVATDVAYGDFDLNFKIMVPDGSRYAEVNVRNVSYIFPINIPNMNVWRDVRVSAHGQTVRCSIDGEAVAPIDTIGTATSGEIGFYSPPPAHVKVKDIAIRTK